MKQYKASIWQSPTGKWNVNCTDDLAGISGRWWVPCRILGLAPADFIVFLKDNYNAKYFHYNKDTNVLLYAWDNYNDAHRWQLYINKVARNKKIYL